jgi:hypothetical protein
VFEPRQEVSKDNDALDHGVSVRMVRSAAR